MSKRRRKKQNKPNLPEATLERARRQAAVERGEMDAESVEEVEALEAAEVQAQAPEKEGGNGGSADTSANPFRTVPAKERRARTGTHTGEDGAVRRKRREGPAVRARQPTETLDHETLVHLLHNPTKTVTPAELQQEYGYVLADLRSMGILAAGLIVTLVVLAVIFV
jgi:hypothetical protein